MAITIRPMERADMPACATIASAAFDTDEIYHRLYPRYREFPLERRNFWLIRLKQRLVEPTAVPLVAESIEGEGPEAKKEIVGYATYVRMGKDPGALARQAKDTYFNKLERYLLAWELRYQLYFEHSDKEAVQALYSVKFDVFDKLDSTGYWYLAGLAVSPTHQRRGIGGSLVSSGIDLANEDNVPIGLQASVVGRGLYAKHGYKVVQTQKTFEDMEDSVAMLWEVGTG